MKPTPTTPPPPDADARRAFEPVICYPIDQLPAFDPEVYSAARASMELVSTTVVAPREAEVFDVPAGHFFRVICSHAPQVGDLNLWNAHDLNERFYTGKTRALYGTHVSTGDRLMSSFPAMRPIATITHDTLDWYGYDAYGGSVHDVIGTRCDPYTNHFLTGDDYDHCCHSNLIRALSAHLGEAPPAIEHHIHDVLNVFMCSGFTPDTRQYFIKESPVRQGDYLEFFAEIDLLGGLSACPGGDCASGHSSDEAACAPLTVEVYRPAPGTLPTWTSPAPSAYAGGHGL